jgi:hypothetical protein
MKIFLFILLFINLFSLDICYSSEISDIDLKIIKYGDVYSGSKIIIKLENLYKLNGEGALKPATPAISERAISIISKAEKNVSLNDSEGEYLGSLLRILSISCDNNAKNALLRAMISEKVTGLVISKGLMRLGPQVMPDIKVYLNDENKLIVGKTILTMKDIAELDSTGIFFSEKDKSDFKEYLLIKLKDFDASLKFFIISAIGYFGDESTINILDEIKNKDNFKKDGIYINRIGAENAIKHIKLRNK